MSLRLEAPHPKVQTISLYPSPERSDVQSQLLSSDLKRSINNTKYTNIKTNDIKRLTYTLILYRLKALELRAFVEAYFTSDIKLIDHNGDSWVVQFSRNPFEFANPAADKTEITLQFEGVKQ